MYVTYITIYSGNKLPPFYIGHAKKENIDNGYFGSVSSKQYKDIWRKELEDNRDLFSIKIIKKFDTKKAALEHEEYLQRFFNVHNNPLYSNCAIVNKNFYVENYVGKPTTEETKQKLREAAKKQFSDENKRKYHLNKFLEKDGNHKNKIWINDGSKNKRVTLEIYNKQYSQWNIGRIFPKGKELYKHNGRRRDPLTGRYMKKEKL